MAKNKKRKGAKVRKQPTIKENWHINKNYREQFLCTARKYMQLIGLEADIFDKLPKRMRENAMMIKSLPPKIYASKEHNIPKIYLRIFNQILLEYMQNRNYGDPSFGIKYMEHMTYGQSLIGGLRYVSEESDLYSAESMEIVTTINEAMKAYEYAEENDVHHYAIELPRFLSRTLMIFSKINYRYYTCDFFWKDSVTAGAMQSYFKFSSIEAERKQIVIDRQTRPAFRLGVYILNPTPTWVEIPLELISTSLKGQGTLPVFIQKHALIRIRERLSPQSNMYINCTFMATFFPLKNTIEIIKAVNGQPLICAYDLLRNRVGYFPFIQQDGCIILTSFLPLSSPITPEGSILMKRLKISIDESALLKMDKLIFYLQTDFDKLPSLRDAIQKAGMWHLTKIKILAPELPEVLAKGGSTTMLAKIFEQKDE